MKTNIEQIPLGDVADALDPPQIRKGGWHVTNLIGEGIAISKGRRADPFDPPEYVWRLINMGRIWEPIIKPWLSAYANLLGYTVEYGSQSSPLEAWKDDILGNLDAKILEGDSVVAIVDMKFTTSKPDITKNASAEKYLHQAKAYCHMEGCTEFWFLVFHVSIVPDRKQVTFNVYKQQFLFDTEELTRTWQLVLGAKNYLTKIGEVPDA